MGSKREKLRVSNVKERADLELLFTSDGLRVDYQKARGLICKKTGRTVIFDSGRLDLDLMVQIGSGRILIWGVGKRSDG